MTTTPLPVRSQLPPSAVEAFRERIKHLFQSREVPKKKDELVVSEVKDKLTFRVQIFSPLYVLAQSDITTRVLRPTNSHL